MRRSALALLLFAACGSPNCNPEVAAMGACQLACRPTGMQVYVYRADLCLCRSVPAEVKP